MVVESAMTRISACHVWTDIILISRPVQVNVSSVVINSQIA